MSHYVQCTTPFTCYACAVHEPFTCYGCTCRRRTSAKHEPFPCYVCATYVQCMCWVGGGSAMGPPWVCCGSAEVRPGPLRVCCGLLRVCYGCVMYTKWVCYGSGTDLGPQLACQPPHWYDRPSAPSTSSSVECNANADADVPLIIERCPRIAGVFCFEVGFFWRDDAK